MARPVYRNSRTDEELRKFSPIVHATGVIGFADRMAQDGYVFSGSHVYNTAPLGLAWDGWVLQTGPSTDAPMATTGLVSASLGDLIVTLHEDVVYTSSSQVDMFNLNRNSTIQAEDLELRMWSVPVVTDYGVTIKTSYIPLQRSDGASIPVEGLSGIQWILKPSTNYLIRVELAQGVSETAPRLHASLSVSQPLYPN